VGAAGLNPTTAGLSASPRRLLALICGNHFGRIEGLEIRGGQPVFDPPPRIVLEFKFGAGDGARPRPAGEFVLKSAMAELFGCLAGFADAVVELLEIQHGLPFRMRVHDRTRL
jgi:hypothetical protein